MTTAEESDALQTSFRQEVAVWHKLDHPNVTKVKMKIFLTEFLFMLHLVSDS